MSTTNIISAIDAEISRLQEARAILARTTTGQASQAATATKPRRTMSAAARKRIAVAMRKRWAAKKRAQ